jgi:hypothetical protein
MTIGSTHFCFRCGVKLSPLDPYSHYSTAGLTCYNKLFDFRPGEEPPVEEWLGAVLGEIAGEIEGEGVAH